MPRTPDVMMLMPSLKRCLETAFVLLVASAAGGTVSQPRPASTLPLKLVADIALPGPTNRFDYQSYDSTSHRLFIAHLGASKVIAFDTRANKLAGEIANISQVHGVLVVPATGKIYASATGTNEIAVIDAQTLKEVARGAAGVYPDGIAYAPDVHKLYVSDETGRTETVIDTETNRRVATIALDGEVGNTQYDAASRRIFVNVQTLNRLVEIDPQTDEVIGRYALPGARHNHGLLIDSTLRVAYVACEGNAKLLVFDLDSKQVLASEAVGDDPDVLALDEALHWLYVASESGVVSIFEQDGKRLKKIGEAMLAKRAHSVAVDPETHRVYFPLENVNGRAVLRIMEPVRQ
ncbi:MAG: YncE family protein [Rudaea sp.]